MFTAYHVRVLISLTDHVSASLSHISRQFAVTATQATAAQRALNATGVSSIALHRQITAANSAAASLQARIAATRALAGTGILLGGAAFLGFEAIKHAVKPAMEYAHQLNIMNNLGMTQKEIAEAVGAAWKNTNTVITTTATENLRTLVDLRNILGDKGQMTAAGRLTPISMEMAYSMLPTLTRLQAAIMSSTVPAVAAQGKDDKFIYSMAKALDIRGAATSPEKFQRESDLMSRAIIGMQGRITPDNYMQAFIYARQQKFQLTDQFLYERGMPTLLLEQGGGGQRGIGPMLAALNRYFVQNIHGGQAVKEAIDLGFVESDPFTKKGKPNPNAHMKWADLALTDPYSLAVDKVLPAILKKHPGADETTIIKEVNLAFRGNQLLADLMTRFIHQQINFLTDQRAIAQTLPTGQVYQQALLRDPETALRAFHAQWENLMVAFGSGMIPIIIPTLMTAAEGLNAFTAALRGSPILLTTVTYAFTALTAALGFSGLVYTLRAAFAGLSVVLAAGGFVTIAGLAGTLGGIATALLVLGAAAIAFSNTPLGRSFFPNWGGWPDGAGSLDSRPRKWGDPVTGGAWEAKPGESFINPWATEGLSRSLKQDWPQVPGSKFTPYTGSVSADMRERNVYDDYTKSKAAWTAYDWPPPGEGPGLGPTSMGPAIARNTMSMASGDMRERNVVTGMADSISGFARDIKEGEAAFLDRLGAIMKEALAAGLAHMSVNLDGSAVGKIMDQRANTQMSRPPRDGGGLDIRVSPVWPGSAW